MSGGSRSSNGRNSSRSNGKSSKNGQARRGNNKSGSSKGGQKGGSSKGGQKGQQGSTKSRSRKRKKSKFNARQFWGSPSQLPTPTGYTTATDDPIALVTSLGRPPIPGNESAAEAYFQMLYTRAGALAGALAAAGGLDEIVADESPAAAASDQADDDVETDDADETETDDEGADG